MTNFSPTPPGPPWAMKNVCGLLAEAPRPKVGRWLWGCQVVGAPVGAARAGEGAAGEVQGLPVGAGRQGPPPGGGGGGSERRVQRAVGQVDGGEVLRRLAADLVEEATDVEGLAVGRDGRVVDGADL